MKFGIREVADVMLKAKVDGQKVGYKEFKKGQPVCHFDSLKTSTVEGAATTVYAMGGKGNPRLIAWEGERTLTLTMEDALISKMGIAILTGAGLIDATSEEPVPVHFTETVVCKTEGELTVKYEVFNQDTTDTADIWIGVLDDEGNSTGEFIEGSLKESSTSVVTGEDIKKGKGYIVDYYTKGTSGITQIDIEPNKFGGNYYLEGSTLFRNTSGVDMPAEFIVPNCKIQSNFTFTMASSGDPSTFTYTVDAFPGVTKHNPAKKVLCAIYMVETMPEEVKATQGE
jgi:hypothetical protein